MNFYWVGIEESQIFKTLLGKKKRRTGYVVNEDWIKDAGENANIIWEWWKPIFMIWVSPMRHVNIVVDRVVTIIQKVMEHSSIDKNELQDEVDAAERNVADGKNTLDATKVNGINAQEIVVSTHSGSNRIKNTRHVVQDAVAQCI